jgi:hypothetical protein
VKKDIPTPRMRRLITRLIKLIGLKMDLETLKRLRVEGRPQEEIEALKKQIREEILGETKKSRSERLVEKKRITCPYWCPSFGERCPYRCPTAIPLYLTKSHLMN